MTATNLTCAVLAIALLGLSPVAAQEIAPPLPAICTANAGHAMAPMDSGHQMGTVDEAHQDLALGMAETNAQMMQGITATDIDTAFVCAMIPHHQSAINMARAELAHGDDPWGKELAQKIIDAQQQEIADMLSWLEQQAE